jgi:hypothetical protein
MLMKNKINSNFIIKQIKNKKGFALLGTLILVFVVSTFGIALLTMTQNDIKLSALQKASKETFYIAESGIEHAISYLEEMGTPNFSTPTNPFYTEENKGYLDMGNGEYEVTIESAGIFSYIIQSTGERPWTNSSGWITKTIESKVILENFAMYAYFSDNELFPASIDASYGGQKIWFYGTDHIGGPLHSNDRLHMAGTPTFDGPVTSAYVNNTTVPPNVWEAYDSQTNPIFLGAPPYEGGVNRIELPQYREISKSDDPKSLQRIAAGSENLINLSSTGTYLPYDNDVSKNVTAGIWVKGDVDTLTLGTELGNSQIKITQGSLTTTITTITTPVTYDGTIYSSGTLVKKPDNSYVKYNGFHNGVLFVNGKVNNLSSTTGGVKGKLTLASNSTITIGNNLLYNTRVIDEHCFDVPAGTYPNIPDSLGLVSEGNIMIKRITPNNNIEINAIVMALGTSFFYEGWKDTLKGNLIFHGSFIQKQRGPVGTFSTYGGKVSGYTKDYQFDTRMSINNPGLGQALPPYFPTTGKYVKLYWKEVD